MPNIAVTFRQEITRLARREIRAETQVLRKTSAQYRRSIAELKRHAAELQAEVARLLRQVGKEGAPQSAEAESGRVRFSAKGVSANRTRLGISAADYGKLVGVTGHTIYKWEHRTSHPRRAQLAALACVRGLGKREALAQLAQMRKKALSKRAAKR